MAEKDASTAKKTATPKKSAAKKAPAKKAPVKKEAASKKAPDHVTVDDMHRLLKILEDGLFSRDKVVDHLQTQIAQNQERATQNQKILAKRATVSKLVFVILVVGMTYIAFDQYSIVKSFDDDMTTVARDMDVMMKEMTAMRIAMESMSKDMHSMSGDFSTVSKDVSSIAKDVKGMSQGVRGMSRDTREMNRSMDTMTPPWSPFR